LEKKVDARRKWIKAAAVAGTLLGTLLLVSGNARAKKVINDLQLIKPTLTITQQTSTPGTCFGGTTEPCDVFVIQSKFKCASDCATDFADAVSGSHALNFTISTSNTCPAASPAPLYTATFSMNHFITTTSKKTTTYTFPATFKGTDGGRDFLVGQIQLAGKSGFIIFSGNGDFHAATGSVFLGFGEADTIADSDTSDTVCAPLTSTTNHLN
jgi:hypothetical protein